MDGDAIDDLEDFAIPQEQVKTLQIKFKKFHELPVTMRVDILHFLCQTRLDAESTEFTQEIAQVVQDRKAGRKAAPANVLDDPVAMLSVKPIGEVSETMKCTLGESPSEFKF